jgi:hypothetical protein
MIAKRVHAIAAGVAAAHLLGVLLTEYYVSGSSDGQAPLVWVYWMFIDLPWSLPLWELMSGKLILIHGVIGTVWWYLLTIFIERLIAFVRTKAPRSRA